MGREGGEEDTVESRKLKVEGQPKRRRIHRKDAEHTEITQRGGLRCGSARMVAQYQIPYYHMITVSVK